MNKMKMLFAVTCLFSMNTVLAATPVMRCSKAEMIKMDGQGGFQPVNLTMAIYKSASGYKSEIKIDDQSASYTDVAVDVVPAEKAGMPKELASVVFPKLQWSLVKNVRVGNINTKANADDSAGFFILDLLDSSGRSLGKMFTAGWAGGICRE